MTVSNTNLRSPATGGYACDGANQDFAGTFTIQAAEDVDVILRDADGAETTLTLTSDYTVTPTTDYQTDSFTVTTVATYDATYTITLIRSMAYTQPNAISNSGRYNPAVVMSNDDRNLLLIQQNAEELNRCIKQDASDPTALDDAAYLAACVAAQAGAETAETGAETAETGAAASLASMQAAGYYLSEYASLSAAVTAIGATEAELIIDQDDTLTGNIITPSTLALRFVNGSIITTSTYTLTINGAIFSPLVQLFVSTGGLVDGDIQNKAIYPQWFGAAGDGVTDDTDAINNCMLTGVNVIDGSNREYIVTSVVMQTGKTLRNISLKELDSAVEISLVPVVRIGDDLVAVTDVTLENVLIDGNRQNLANITFSNGEDGGMHGIRIGGLCTDIRIINCQANYCGTAGLALHSEQFGATADYSIKRVYVDNFVAEWNREHGMFADSFDGFYINGAVLNNNGQDITPGQPDTSGLSGAKVGSVEFGGGFDIESYAGFPSSYMKNFYGNNITCKGNAQAPQLYIPNAPDDVSEIPCYNIHLTDCDFDKSTLGTNLYSFRFFADSAVAGKYGIDTVIMSGLFNGHITANNIKGVSLNSGWIEPDSSIAYKALMNNSEEINISAPSNVDHIKVETLSSLGVVTDTGAGTWTPTISTSILADGVQQLKIDGNISGGTIAGGAMSYTLTMPTGVSIVSGYVSAFNSTSAVSVVANVQVLTSSTCRVYITPIDNTVTVNLRLIVLL